MLPHIGEFHKRLPLLSYVIATMDCLWYSGMLGHVLLSPLERRPYPERFRMESMFLLNHHNGHTVVNFGTDVLQDGSDCCPTICHCLVKAAGSLNHVIVRVGIKHLSFPYDVVGYYQCTRTRKLYRPFVVLLVWRLIRIDKYKVEWSCFLFFKLRQ